jgi:outer membrane protein
MQFALTAILLFLISSLAVPQQYLSLDEAMRIALNRNTAIQKTVNNLTTYESDVKTSYGNFLPTLGVSSSFDWRRSERDFETPAGEIQFSGETRTYSAGAGTNWVLFDGLANFASLSQSKANLQSAQLSFERLKQDIVFSTISRYYDIIYLRQLLRVRQEDVLWNQKNLETITERNRLGAVTLADVYAQQVRVGNAEVEVIRTRNSMETAISNMLYFLGLDVFENYEFPDSLVDNLSPEIDEPFIETTNLSELVSQALSNRADYKSARLLLESAERGITIARSGHFPRLTNSMNIFAGADNPGDIFKGRTYSLGLTLSIPIFSGFAVENRVQYAEVLTDNRKIDLNDLEREIKLNIQKAYLDLQAAEKSLEVSRRSVTAAEENRKIEAEKYNLGAGTLLNVLIANSDYITAQTHFINAQFQFIVISKQLRYYLGIIETSRYE